MMKKNLMASLWGDETGHHFCVIGVDFEAQCLSAIDASKHLLTYQRQLLRYQGICWSLPGVHEHVLARRTS